MAHVRVLHRGLCPVFLLTAGAGFLLAAGSMAPAADPVFKPDCAEHDRLPGP